MSEKIVCLDIEATGLDVAKDHAVQIVLQFIGEDHQYEWVVRPPIPIPEDVSAIHGFTDTMVSSCPSFGMVAEEIKNIIETADGVVGYNPDYDIAILTREFELARCPVTWPRAIVCCKRLWDQQEPRPKRSLENAYKRFIHGKGFANGHNAKADVAATIQVFNCMKFRWNLEDKPFQELDAERAKWVGGSDHFVWKDAVYKDTLLCNFGKFKGKFARELDAGYLKYLIDKDFPPHVKQLADKLKRLPYPEAVRWARENL